VCSIEGREKVSVALHEFTGYVGSTDVLPSHAHAVIIDCSYRYLVLFISLLLYCF